MWNDFTTYDGYVVMLYLGVILAISIYFLVQQGGGADTYFFAGRRTRWFAVGASLFSAQFMLGIVIPLSGSLVSGAVLVMGCVLATGIGIFLVRKAMRRVPALADAGALSDSLRRLFYRSQPGYPFVVQSLLLLLIRLIAVFLFYTYATDRLLDWGPGKEIILILLFVGFYSIVGGFQAVVVTQAFQAVPIAAGIVMLAVYGANGARILTDGIAQLPVLSLAGLALVLGWSFGADHFIVQHLEGAGSRTNRNKGIAAAAMMNVFCLAAVLLAGMLGARASAPAPESMVSLVWRGIVAAGILAVTMAQLAGIFSSGAAVFTLSIFHTHHPEASGRTLVLVGRLATTAIVIASIVAATTVRLIGHAGIRPLQTSVAMLVAPIAALVCMMLFQKTERYDNLGWVLGASAFIGGLRVLLEILVIFGVAGEWTALLLGVDYLSLTAFLFVFTLVLLAGIGIKISNLRTS